MIGKEEIEAALQRIIDRAQASYEGGKQPVSEASFVYHGIDFGEAMDVIREDADHTMKMLDERVVAEMGEAKALEGRELHAMFCTIAHMWMLVGLEIARDLGVEDDEGDA